MENNRNVLKYEHINQYENPNLKENQQLNKENNIIDEDDNEELDQSYNTNKQFNYQQENNFINEDDDLEENEMLYEPEEEENDDFIDFNNQMNLDESENEGKENKDLGNEEEIEDIGSEQGQQQENEISNDNQDKNQNTEEVEKEKYSEDAQAQEKDVLQSEKLEDMAAKTNIIKEEEQDEENKETELNNEIKNKIASRKAMTKTKKYKKPQEKKDRVVFEDKRETKTIFSKISEEIFYQLAKDKYKKSSSYDYMINDIYINRVVQKGDPSENKNKFNNFIGRNKEFFNKKKLRLNEKIQKISEETNTQVYAIPNKKVFEKNQLRNPDQFFDDQKNFVLQKEQNLENQREEIIKQNIILAHNYIPEIDPNSKSIAQKNLSGESAEVFERLHKYKVAKSKNKLFEDQDERYNENNLKFEKEDIENNINANNLNNKAHSNNKNSKKNRISNTAKNIIEKNAKTQNKNLKQVLKSKEYNPLSVNPNRKSLAHLQGYSSKLHNDARNWLLRNEERIKKVYYKAAPDLQCNQSKLLNTKKFMENFNESIQELNIQPVESHEQIDDDNTKSSLLYFLNFENYCEILLKLGFIKNNFEILKENLETIQANKEANIQSSDDSNYEGDLASNKKTDVGYLNRKLVEPEKIKKLKAKKIIRETKLVKDSWKILINNSNVNLNNNEENINSNDILLFLCIVQGYLKGNVNKISEEERKELEQLKLNGLIYKNNVKGIINNKQMRPKSQDKTPGMKGNLKKIRIKMNRDKNLDSPNNEYFLSDNEYKYNRNLSNSNNFKKSNNKENADDNLGSNSININNTSADYNKFKRIKSKDSNNQFMKRSNDNMIEEPTENIYKRKKSKNADMTMNSLNDPFNNNVELKFHSEKKINDKLDSNSDELKDSINPNKIDNNHPYQNGIINKNKTHANQKIGSNTIKNKETHEPSLSNNKKSKLNNEEDQFKSIEKNEIDDLTIMKKVLKFVELEKYHYNRPIAKKIKFIFKDFLRNRQEYLNNHRTITKSSRLQTLKTIEESGNKSGKNKNTINKDNNSKDNHSNRKFFYDRYKQRVINQLENEMTFKPENHTTHPSLNHSNFNKLLTEKRKKLKMEDAYEYQKKKKENELMKQRLMKDELEMKECTFQPNVESREKAKQMQINLDSLVDKLYKDGLTKIKETKEGIKKREEEEINKSIDPNSFTFKPETIPLNQTIFTNKTIEAYEVSKKNVERFERARIEKKIAEIQKQTGITNLNQINNIDTLLKENNYPSWKFNLEKKSCKDTFDNTVRFLRTDEKKNETEHNILNTFNTVNAQTHSNLDQAIYLDVNLNDNSTFKKLKIAPGDDPKIIADEFAKKFDLPEEKKLKLTNLIEEKMIENKFIISSDSKNSPNKN